MPNDLSSRGALAKRASDRASWSPNPACKPRPRSVPAKRASGSAGRSSSCRGSPVGSPACAAGRRRRGGGGAPRRAAAAAAPAAAGRALRGARRVPRTPADWRGRDGRHCGQLYAAGVVGCGWRRGLGRTGPRPVRGPARRAGDRVGRHWGRACSARCPRGAPRRVRGARVQGGGQRRRARRMGAVGGGDQGGRPAARGVGRLGRRVRRVRRPVGAARRVQRNRPLSSCGGRRRGACHGRAGDGRLLARRRGRDRRRRRAAHGRVRRVPARRDPAGGGRGVVAAQARALPGGAVRLEAARRAPRHCGAGRRRRGRGLGARRRRGAGPAWPAWPAGPAPGSEQGRRPPALPVRRP